MTATPEFRPLWGARSHHGTISLVPLDRVQVLGDEALKGFAVADRTTL